MRTDGLQMSAEALEDIRSTVQFLYGNDYLPAQPRVYKCAFHRLILLNYHALTTPASASKLYSFCLECASYILIRCHALVLTAMDLWTGARQRMPRRHTRQSAPQRLACCHKAVAWHPPRSSSDYMPWCGLVRLPARCPLRSFCRCC